MSVIFSLGGGLRLVALLDDRLKMILVYRKLA